RLQLRAPPGLHRRRGNAALPGRHAAAGLLPAAPPDQAAPGSRARRAAKAELSRASRLRRVAHHQDGAVVLGRRAAGPAIDALEDPLDDLGGLLAVQLARHPEQPLGAELLAVRFATRLDDAV